MKRFTATLSCACLLASSLASQTHTTTITGMLLDDRNQPAVGVPITLLLSDKHDYRAAIKKPLTRSLADGTFRVTSEVNENPATYLLIGGKEYATRRTLIPRETKLLDLGPVSLARGFTATGRVRDKNGKAVVGALVVGTDLLPTRPFLWQTIDRAGPAYHTETIVPEHGIFMLPGQLHSAGVVTVSCAGYFDVTVQPVAMGTPLDITLKLAPTITGRAIDADGQPVAGAQVRLGSSKTESAADGTFSLSPRKRGLKSITAFVTKDKQRLNAKATVRDNVVGLIELKFDEPVEKEVPTVRVRAVSATGNELKIFDAYSSWNPGNQMQYRPDAQLLRAAANKAGLHGSTDAGVVTLAGKGTRRDDTLWIFVRAEGHGWGKIEADIKAHGGKPVTVKMTKPSALRGRVVDRVSGKPIAGVTIAPTQRLAKNTKRWFEMGHYQVSTLVGPDAVVTDADGRWQLDNVPPGELDLFVIVSGHSARPPMHLDIKAGEHQKAIDFEIPNTATLNGTITGNRVAGLQIRPHWHRPNVSNSAWAREYDGAVTIAPDGSFSLPDLAPLLYELQVVLPTPPRGGMRRKLPCANWNGAAPPKKPWADSYAKLSIIEGHVGGEIPWSRLAVLAVVEHPNTFNSQFAPPGTLALLGPDRKFRMLLPEEKVRMIVFDVLTGIAIEFRDIEPAEMGQPIVWTGRSHSIDVRLRDRDVDAQSKCTIHYGATEDHWPLRVHPAFAAQQRSGMQMIAIADDDITLWLPEKSGQLRFTAGSGKLQFQVDRMRESSLTIVVSSDTVEQRK